MPLVNEATAGTDSKQLVASRHFEALLKRLQIIRENLTTSRDRLDDMANRVNAPQEAVPDNMTRPGREEQCGLFHMYNSELDELAAVSDSIAARIYELEQSI